MPEGLREIQSFIIKVLHNAIRYLRVGTAVPLPLSLFDLHDYHLYGVKYLEMGTLVPLLLRLFGLHQKLL